jgi:penicillin amidase
MSLAFNAFGKHLLWTLFAGAILSVATGVGGLLWLTGSLPDIRGTIDLNGLKAPVEIRRDEYGVPHIKAWSASDAYFALGYVHAQDRLFQMELTRRLGAGRLAEVIGVRGLPSDRMMRLFGIYRLAERQYQGLASDVRMAFADYALGVNAWLSKHSSVLPPEYYALGFRPEPWRPADSLVWLRIMAMRLSGNWRGELLRARLNEILPVERVRSLWPPYPAGAVTTLGALPSSAYDISLMQLANADPEPPGLPRGASNAWVIGSGGTTSGKPILANDPHLRFGAPILWYLATIKAPGLTLAGATVPGMPFHIVGHNGRVAWGLTSTATDMEDLFAERLDPNDHGRYLAPGGSMAFGNRRESISVKGDLDENMRIRTTRHGPVLSDVLGGSVGGKTVLALSAVYLDGTRTDRTPEGLFALNRAVDWDGFVSALKSIEAPQQNVFYADVDGNIGFLAPGRVPIRRSGRGRLPVPGWTGEADWVGYVPFEDLPRVYNPPAGLLVNANNRIIGPDYPYFLTDDWAPPYRAQRLSSLLQGKAQSIESTGAVQRDAVSLMARHLSAMMRRSIKADTGRDRRALDMLDAWDGTMARDRPEPLIFTSWLRQLNFSIYGDELAELTTAYWNLRPLFTASVLNGENGDWCAIKGKLAAMRAGSEPCKAVLAEALTHALDALQRQLGNDMSEWYWGDLHRAHFRHPIFSGIPLLGRYADLSIASDGGDATVNRGSSHISNSLDPYGHIHGAGLRVIFDLGDLDNSRYIIATGQSGNPLSPHYRDLLSAWRDGRNIKLEMRRSDDREINILKLMPPRVFR